MPTKPRRIRRSRKRAAAMLMTFALLSLVMVASTAYIDYSTQAIRMARLSNFEARTAHLCEAGAEALLSKYWKTFKVAQHFSVLDSEFFSASEGNPKGTVSGQFSDVGAFSAAVIGYETPPLQNATRRVTVRTVGWIDHNLNGVLDADEPRKTIDSVLEFSLKRSEVFDYAQFVNNYGWIKGFNQNNMIINGDWRVNGDFDLVTGTATVNGSVIAAANTKLTPAAIGKVNKTPYKWEDTTYKNWTTTNKAWAARMRQSYDPAIHGAIGSAEFEKWRDLVYFSEGEMVGGKPFGSTVQDTNGIRAWQRTSAWAKYRQLDENPTEEIVMPDLSDFGSPADPASPSGGRFARSKAWLDARATWDDGTANPNYSGNANSANEFLGDGTPNVAYAGAYVDVWDPTLNSGAGAYKRVSNNGVVDGSVLLIGTSARPIRIHGPVSVNGDLAIGGVVQGQGTIYASRNVHIASSLKYKNAPDFRGNNIANIEKVNQKRDFIGLAALGSVMIGDTDTYTNDELSHMVPPFTRSRLDENGDLINAFDAKATDEYGIKKYESLLKADPDLWAKFKAEALTGVNQIDAIVYTNNTIGGQAGYEGGGMTINGSMVCKDLAIVAYSAPIRMNYDGRVRDRGGAELPLIDLDLPRGPAVRRVGWQDHGFDMR